uniref:Uncharacterized protein n=1 Tax=Anopheles coluzzii TaxID=1518534 RepID=A0A8W7P005_ANOCL
MIISSLPLTDSFTLRFRIRPARGLRLVPPTEPTVCGSAPLVLVGEIACSPAVGSSMATVVGCARSCPYFPTEQLDSSSFRGEPEHTDRELSAPIGLWVGVVSIGA